jgi:tRNA(Ile)-lysidine synthase
MVVQRKVPKRGAHTLLRQCEEFIRVEGLLKYGERIIVAVSGGIDSMVLLNLLVSLRDKFHLELIVGHVNHTLRGRESNGDQQFVEETAKRHGIRCIVARIATKEYAGAMKMSIQDAARELRYAFLKELHNSSSADWIATAHQADDNAETLLLHFIRGTGLQGLRGILPKREEERIIRPLLFARRYEIAAYAKYRHIAFREDSSNSKDTYSRNALRHKVLPVLEQYINRGIVHTLNTNARLFEQTGRLIDHAHDVALSDCVRSQDSHTYGVRVKKLSAHPVEMQQALFHRLFSRLPGAPVSYTSIAQIMRLCNAQVGKRIQLNKRWNIIREREELVLSDLLEDAPIDLSLESYGILRGSGITLTVEQSGAIGTGFKKIHRRRYPRWATTEYVDADTLRFPLRLRKWQKGDWFIPLGMKGRKKVSNFLSDVHIPARQKKTIYVLSSGDDILWVCGVRLDNRFRVLEHTQNIARLQFSRENLQTASDE